MSYNIISHHIPASRNGFGDYFSCFPSTGFCTALEYDFEKPQFRVNVEGPIRIGKNVINKVVQTEQTFDKTDPWLIQISCEGEDCEKFRELKQLVLTKPHLQENFQLKKDHPHKSVENLISEMSLKKIPETNKEVIIRDGMENFITTKFRKEILEELHCTHLSTEPIKRLTHGEFWWPKINGRI